MKACIYYTCLLAWMVVAIMASACGGGRPRRCADTTENIATHGDGTAMGCRR